MYYTGRQPVFRGGFFMNRDKCFIGAKFNYFTVVGEPYSIKKGRYTKWLCKCKCECGAEKDVICDSLVSEKTKSCGCYNKIAASNRMSAYSSLSEYKSDTSHPLYGTFKSIKINGKGMVCEDWVSYDTFYEWAINNGWSDGLVLRRKNRDEQYCPDNCYFDTKANIIKENLNTEKARQTCISKYGVDSYTKTDEYKIRVKETCLEKYGVDSQLKAESVKAKIKKTNLEKYGYENAAKSDNVKKKTEETCLTKFGTKSPSQNKEIYDKQVETCIERYGRPIYNQSSLAEQTEIKNWLLSIGFEFNSNYELLKPKEIDLYNETLKVGIEYCGLYWHTERYTGKDAHKFKYEKCKEKGVRLFTIFSDEWLFRGEQVRSFLSSALGISTHRIFARKCEVAEISNSEAETFLEQYHIQGSGRSHKLCVGIFYEKELVGVTTFNKHHRNNNDFILDRLAFKAGYQIVGGVSKMVKLGVDYCKTNGIDKIITWSDNRWSNGKVYESCGFVLDKELPIDYFYIKLSDTKKRVSKQSSTKSKIECPEGKTEYEYMKELGYDRVWDCGKKRFILTVS